MPTPITRRFGYDLEFDADARHVGLALVIFDPPFLPRLFAAPRGPYLKQNLPFMKGPAWVRHDEHYHVDFDVPCEPIGTSPTGDARKAP